MKRSRSPFLAISERSAHSNDIYNVIECKFFFKGLKDFQFFKLSVLEYTFKQKRYRGKIDIRALNVPILPGQGVFERAVGGVQSLLPL